MKNVKASLGAMEKIIDSINVSVRDYNKSIKHENDTIQSYNDSIYKVKWADRMQGFTVIINGDSLNKHLQQAQPGDTFIVKGPITLGKHLLLHLRGTASNHIALIGDLLTENIISLQGDQGDIVIDSCEYFDISNISIKGSQRSGLKLTNHSNNINLNNCIIEENDDYGLEVSTSGINLTNCKIQNNKKGGIWFVPELPGDYDLYLTNVLIAKNKGFGIDFTTPSAILSFVTITNNDSDGISIVSPSNSSLSIFNSIISFNKGFGILQKRDENLGAPIVIGMTDFFQNGSGNFSSNLSPYIIGDFFSADPNFADTANNDFSIAPGGKIYELEKSQINTTVGYR